MKNGFRAYAFLMAMAFCLVVFAGCNRGRTQTTAGGDAAREAAGADTDYGPEIALTFGSSSAAQDITTQGMEVMKKIVEERSSGKIKLNLYPASQLGPSLEQMEMVADGSIDLFIEANFVSTFGVPDSNSSTGYFQVKDRSQFRKVVESDLTKEWYAEFLRLNNTRIIANNWYRNWASIISKKPIQTLEDMKGLKIRIPQVEISIRQWASTGCTPTPVAYSETLLALQQGVVDAAWLTQDAMYTMGFYEVAKYIFECRSFTDCLMIYMNEDRYQSITPAQRDLILTAAYEAGEWYSNTATDALARNNKLMQDAGVTLYQISDAEWEKFSAVLSAARDQFEAEGMWSKGLNARIQQIINN